MMIPRSAALSAILALALSFIVSAAAQAGDKDDLSFFAATTSRPIFYTLPADVLDGAQHTLELTVTEGGAVAVREKLAFTADAEALKSQPVVEALGLHPGLRARFAEPAHAEARVSFFVDGTFRSEETFAELIAKSAELERQGRLAPVGIQSRQPEGESPQPMRSITAAVTPAGCVYQCDVYHQSCDNNCGARPTCEDNCYRQFTNCLHNCGCPVVTDQWTVTTFMGYTPVNTPSVCLLEVINPPFNSGHYYLKYLKTFKNEHWQRIVDCEGLMNDVVASVDYTTTDCYKRQSTLPNAPTCFAASPGMDIYHACVFQ
jgi:hypothetical protein